MALTTVGMVAAGVLMGCGSAKKAQQDVATAQTEVAVSQQAEAKEKAESKSGESTIIRCSWWGGDLRHQAMLKVIEDYEEKNPGITVEGEYQGYDGYYEKMMTTLSSGTAPNVMLFKREWLADVQGAKHYLADLGQLPVDTSTLAEGLLEKSGTYKDEAVLFPCTVTGQVLYVNKDFASKQGVELDKTYTWDEFMDLGKTIHEEDQDSYLMTADIDVLNHEIEPFPGEDWLDGSPIFEVLCKEANEYSEKEQIRARRAFYAQCTQIDYQIRLLIGTLRECGELDNTILLFVSDHGDQLFRHNMLGKRLFYEESARVPLIISGNPIMKRKKTVQKKLACLEDIMPTLLDLCGIPIPDTSERISLISGRERPYLYGEIGEGAKAQVYIL
jgi:hypothetical protein